MSNVTAEITEGKPYALEGTNGRKFVTTQYALLAQGKSEREFPLIACSEGKFTDVCLSPLRVIFPY